MHFTSFHPEVEIVRNSRHARIVVLLARPRLLLWRQETNVLQKIDCEEKYFIPSQEFSHTNPLSNPEWDHFVILYEPERVSRYEDESYKTKKPCLTFHLVLAI